MWAVETWRQTRNKRPWSSDVKQMMETRGLTSLQLKPMRELNHICKYWLLLIEFLSLCSSWLCVNLSCYMLLSFIINSKHFLCIWSSDSSLMDTEWHFCHSRQIVLVLEPSSKGWKSCSFFKHCSLHALLSSVFWGSPHASFSTYTSGLRGGRLCPQQ